MNEKSKFQLTMMVATVAFALTAQQSLAQGLESQFDYKIVEVAENGSETLVARDSVYPGEMIEYAISHVNKEQSELSGLSFFAPIPDGATLAYDTDFSSLDAIFEIQAEMDPEHEGLEWSTVPASRIVIAADGTVSNEPVPADAVEAVRWNIQSALKSGESALNTYRVVVN